MKVVTELQQIVQRAEGELVQVQGDISATETKLDAYYQRAQFLTDYLYELKRRIQSIS